jgi:hypothetical protein
VPNWPSTAVTCGIAGRWPPGMIVGRGGTTAVSDLPAAHGLAGTAGPQLTIEERGDPRAPPRGRRVTPPGEQTATDLGRPGDVRGTDPLTVPSRETTLDPASTPPNRRPPHSTRAAPIGPAAGRRELLLGLPTDPRRTRRARLPGSGKYGVVDPEPSRHRPRPSPRRAKLAAFPARASLGAFSPQPSSVSTRCCFSGSTCCSWWSTRPVASTSSESPRTRAAPGLPSRRAPS